MNRIPRKQSSICHVRTRIALVSVLLCVTVFGSADPRNSLVQPTSTISDDDVQVYLFDAYEVSIIAFQGSFEIIYEPSQTLSIQEVLQRSPYRYLINGSFFELSGEHAGWLSISGQPATPLKDDRQLTHIVILNNTTGEMAFTSAKHWAPSMSDTVTLEFQTGPQVIQANTLDMASIRQSINGRRSHQRTLLAYTGEDRIKYFITVRKSARLDELGEYLLRLSVFEGKTLFVVNLDGGPSVALETRAYPEINYNGDAVLPILFAVR